MVELHPQMIKKDGKKLFVVLPFEEFVQLEEELADYYDLQLLLSGRQEEMNTGTLTLLEIKKELNIE